jgi:hypothetical protein
MRNALAALTLCCVSFFASAVSAQTYDDLFDDGVYNIPPAVAFGDSAYATSLSLAVTSIIGLLLVCAILALAMMNRSDKPRK